MPLLKRALKPKDYADAPTTLGEHLKRRRKLLGLLQREAAARIGCDQFTYINWETDKARPIAPRFKKVIEFLGYDPLPEPESLAERILAKRRAAGLTFKEVAQRLGIDSGTLSRYLCGTRPIPQQRRAAIEAFAKLEQPSLRQPSTGVTSATASSGD